MTSKTISRSECCNGNCNQGRECPLRIKKESPFINGFLLILSGFLIGLMISKFSTREMYHYGYNTAMNNHSEMCTKWWFNDSAQRLQEAKTTICRK